jgi:hypothetical protein
VDREGPEDREVDAGHADRAARAFEAARADVVALGVDAMRYYLCARCPLGNDGDFTFESMFSRYNADLANDLGNLVSRSLTMIGKFGAQVRSSTIARSAEAGPHKALADAAAAAIRDGAALLDGYAPSRALEAIWGLVREGNRYVDATQPWVLARDSAKAGELGHVQHGLGASLWVLARLIAPVLPETSRVLRGWLGDEGPIAWPAPDAFATAPARQPAAPHGVLFPRLDDKKQAAIEAAVLPQAAAPAPVEAPKAPPDHVRRLREARAARRQGAHRRCACPRRTSCSTSRWISGEPKPRASSPASPSGSRPRSWSAERPRGGQPGAAHDAGARSRGDDPRRRRRPILGLAGVDGDVPPGTRVR